tara:strand:+ start:1263 stop:1823 length:561 start_codon:yes stop_codon:yes gene_type:complete
MTFIKTYDAFDKGFCEKVIAEYQHNKRIGATCVRNDGIRKDNQQEFNQMDMRNSEIAGEFFANLNDCVIDYMTELGLQNIIGKTYFKNMLVQGYIANNFESYSTWHCEAGTLDDSDRAFVYMLYLNENFEGGTTDFMYQKHQEIPKQGKLVIWPAGYTHTHRGGMLLSGEKIIATGWGLHLPGDRQ